MTEATWPLAAAHTADDILHTLRHPAFRDVIPTLLVVVDRDGRIVITNRRFRAASGYDEEELAGRHFSLLFPEDLRDAACAEFARRLEAEDFSGDISLSFLRKSGMRCSARVTCTVLTGTDDAIEYVVASGIDVAEFQNAQISDEKNRRRAALVALEKRQERLRLSQQFANVGDWEWDIQTGETFWSEQIWPLLGLPRNAFEPNYERFLQCVHPDDRDRVVRAVEVSIHHGSTFEVEHRCVWPDGSVHWLRNAGNVVRDPLGKPARMLGLSIGIDQRKYIEQEQLKRAEQQRSALIREVHHRIKNNLQGIVGLLRTGLNDSSVEPRRAMERAINQINSIALVHGIHGQHDGRELLLCEMVPAIVESHHAPAGEARVVDLHSEVVTPLRVQDSEAVPVALILNELITNAIKHADSAHGRAPVRVSLSVNEGVGDLSIHSPGARLPEGFDFSSGAGQGTGLELIHALMPPEGMSIDYRQAPDGVTTEVRIQSPVVFLHSAPGRQA